MGISRSIFNTLNQKPPLVNKYLYVVHTTGSGNNRNISKYTSDGVFISTNQIFNTDNPGVGGRNLVLQNGFSYDNYLYGQTKYGEEFSTSLNAQRVLWKVDKQTLSYTYSFFPGLNFNIILDTGRDNIYTMSSVTTTNKRINLIKKSDFSIVGTFSFPSLMGGGRYPQLLKSTTDYDYIGIGTSYNEQSGSLYAAAVLTSNNKTTASFSFLEPVSTVTSRTRVRGFIYDKFSDNLAYTRIALQYSGATYSTFVKSLTGTTIKALNSTSVITAFNISEGSSAATSLYNLEHRYFQTSNGDIIYVDSSGGTPKIYRKTWDNFFSGSSSYIYVIDAQGSQGNDMRVDDYDHLYIIENTYVKKYDDYGNLLWSKNFTVGVTSHYPLSISLSS